MEMELYNTTDKTKVLPKFNYEGKMTMGPHETKKIEDYMAPFYKPYAKVGIVARPITRLGTFNPKDFVEPEVEEVVKEEKKEKKVEVKKEEVKVEEPKVDVASEPVKEEEVVEEPKTEEPKEEEKPVEEEEKKEETKKYDKDKLTSMSVKNLRVLADSLGVDVNNLTKKADIVKAILDFQDK